MKNNQPENFFVMTLWGPALPYLEEILMEIKSKFNITFSKKMINDIDDSRLLEYVQKIYEPDKRCVKSYLVDKVKFMIMNSPFLKSQPCYHFKIIVDNPTFNMGLCNETIEMKEHIRVKIKNRLKNYLKDIIIHVTDNFEESKFVWEVCKNNNKHIDTEMDNFWLNIKKFNYIVLRGYDEIFEGTLKENDDIDILIDKKDFKPFLEYTSAVKTNINICSFDIKINDKNRQFDIREVGDNYYDLDWQKNMLKTKKVKNNINILSDENYYYSLLYHCFFHKGYIASKYEKILNTLENNLKIQTPVDRIESLLKFININKYKIPTPVDPQVKINYKKYNLTKLKDLKMSIYNKDKMKLFLEKKIKYNDVFDIVSLKESPHVKYLQTKDKNVFLNYHGIVNQDPLTSEWNKNYSIERFEKLIKEVLKSDINYNIDFNHNNLIVDGAHRASILYFYFGGDFAIKTTKV